MTDGRLRKLAEIYPSPNPTSITPLTSIEQSSLLATLTITTTTTHVYQDVAAAINGMMVAELQRSSMLEKQQVVTQAHARAHRRWLCLTA